MRKILFSKLVTVPVLLCVTGFLMSGSTMAKPENRSHETDYLAHETWEEILARENTVDYPVIFIHGIAGQVKHWERTMETMVGSDYYQMRYYEDNTIYHNYYGERTEHFVWSVSYYTMNPIEESIYGDLSLYAERLRRMVNLIKKMTGHEKVILVAHSMGGLVARGYMTLDQDCWSSVHKILTVGSPNEGVGTSIPIVGQLEDLRKGSEFLENLEEDWPQYNRSFTKWGVVGAIDQLSVFNMNPLGTNSPNSTDSGGPGFIHLSSSIPYGEWEEAFNKYFSKAVYNTEHFGFRLAVNGTHMGLLYHEGTFEGIHWALQK